MIDEKIAEESREILRNADKEGAKALVQSCIDEGGNLMALMDQGFIPGINVIGDLFGRGKLFLPELIRAADVMKTVTDMINTSIDNTAGRKQTSGTVVIATVKGDVHDIGKCIVVSLMRANGLNVLDMGRDVPTKKIIEKAMEVDADIIGTSALLTTTMKSQKELEAALKSEGLRDRFKTLVGGAPVTPRWAARIGADAYAKDAQDGVVQVKKLLGMG